MTDFQKFKKLYKDFGIILKTEKINKVFILILSPTKSSKFVGCFSSGSEIVFDLKGKFLSQSFYE